MQRDGEAGGCSGSCGLRYEERNDGVVLCSEAGEQRLPQHAEQCLH